MGSFLTSHLEFFYGGVLSYYFYRWFKVPISRERVFLGSAVLFVGFYPAALHLVYRTDLLQIGEWVPWMIWGVVLLSVCAESPAKPNVLVRVYDCLLRSQPVLWLGKRSYSVYLLHEFVLIWISALAISAGLSVGWLSGIPYALICIAVTIVAAAAAFAWIEKPGIQLGRMRQAE
jgi:peptidoglycan/LPS O-acetylase OafA/YrhL